MVGAQHERFGPRYGSAVALAFDGHSRCAVASPGTSAERKHQYTAKKTGGESPRQSEAGAIKSCLAADPPTAKAEASQGGGDINKFARRRAMSETRKLAAILVSDIVGYSRLAGADEDRTLARLRGLRSDLVDPAIAAHHGRIIKRTGDGSIIEFRSVVDAVRCALEVQSGMVERNAGVPPERRIEFRVGIHLGDVVEEADGDLMGDGVNVAARLEGICEPGGVCLSEDAYRQVKSRLELQVADLGPQSLKNIAEPVRAYLLRQGAPATQKPPQAGDENARRLGALACARRCARARASCGGRLRLARGLRAAFHGRFR